MNKQLKDLSAAIAALNGSHIATIDNVKVGTPVYSIANMLWSTVIKITGDEKYPIVTGLGTYTKQGMNCFRNEAVIYLIDPINGTLPPEEEIDWSKVDFGVDAIVHDSLKAKFITYESDNTACWYYSFSDRRPLRTIRANIKLAPHVDIKPEWVKK